MKVGIITYHNAANYGAVLQATALADTIENTIKNSDVEIIDFTPVVVRKKDIKVILSKAMDLLRRKKKGGSPFWAFLTANNKVSEKYDEAFDLRKLNARYDAFVVGSDQVWNPDAIDEQRAFFLGFADPEKITVSYAASFGVSSIEDESKRQVIRELIDKIRYVSVREKDGVELVKQFCPLKPVSWLPDPTLLCGQEYWASFAQKGKPNFDVESEKYIFAYFNRTPHLNNYLKQIQKLTGLKVVVVHRSQINESEQYWKDYDCTPYTFLKYIQNAEYIFTDSFHGTCFSIVFEKKFVTCADRHQKRNSAQCRIVNLCQKLYLEDRILYDDMKEIPNFDEVCYDKMTAALAEWREESVQFLTQALGENNMD